MDSEWVLESLADLFPRLALAFQRRSARDLDAFGLTLTQFLTLLALEEFEGTSCMAPLAQAIQHTAASMTGIADRLLEQGLIQRERHPQDRRSVVVQLTEEGHQLLAQAKEVRFRRWEAVLKHLSPQDRERIPIILSTLITALEADNE